MKAVDKHDFEATVSTQAFPSEKEAMMACHQLAEEKCQAIFKPKDDTNYFTLGSEFILLTDDNSTIFVKKDFLSSLGKYELPAVDQATLYKLYTPQVFGA